MLTCPKCGGQGRIVSYEFRAYGVFPPQTLHKGECMSCGFTAHSSGSRTQAEAWFTDGITRNPAFDPWREAAERAAQRKAQAGTGDPSARTVERWEGPLE